MPKLTVAQRRCIQSALDHLNRAAAYIDQPGIALGRLGGPATTSLHFTRPDGQTFYPLAKDIGSDIAGLAFAREHLSSLLAVDAERRT